MDAIRILLAEVPRMLREIIEAVVGEQEDMSIVGMIPLRDRIGTALETTPADVLIVGLRPAETTESVDRVLYDRPRLKVLAITGDGRTSTFCELRPYRVPLGNVSPAGLVDAIRTMATSESR